jgi:hypothetical protein
MNYELRAAYSRFQYAFVSVRISSDDANVASVAVSSLINVPLESIFEMASVHFHALMSFLMCLMAFLSINSSIRRAFLPFFLPVITMTFMADHPPFLFTNGNEAVSYFMLVQPLILMYHIQRKYGNRRVRVV